MFKERKVLNQNPPSTSDFWSSAITIFAIHRIQPESTRNQDFKYGKFLYPASTASITASASRSGSSGSECCFKVLVQQSDLHLQPISPTRPSSVADSITLKFTIFSPLYLDPLWQQIWISPPRSSHLVKWTLLCSDGSEWAVKMGAVMGTGVGLTIGFIGGSLQILRWVFYLGSACQLEGNRSKPRYRRGGSVKQHRWSGETSSSIIGNDYSKSSRSSSNIVRARTRGEELSIRPFRSLSLSSGFLDSVQSFSQNRL